MVVVIIKVEDVFKSETPKKIIDILKDKIKENKCTFEYMLKQNEDILKSIYMEIYLTFTDNKDAIWFLMKWNNNENCAITKEIL